MLHWRLIWRNWFCMTEVFLWSGPEVNIGLLITQFIYKWLVPFYIYCVYYMHYDATYIQANINIFIRDWSNRNDSAQWKFFLYRGDRKWTLAHLSTVLDRVLIGFSTLFCYQSLGIEWPQLGINHANCLVHHGVIRSGILWLSQISHQALVIPELSFVYTWYQLQQKQNKTTKSNTNKRKYGIKPKAQNLVYLITSLLFIG